MDEDTKTNIPKVFKFGVASTIRLPDNNSNMTAADILGICLKSQLLDEHVIFEPAYQMKLFLPLAASMLLSVPYTHQLGELSLLS